MKERRRQRKKAREGAKPLHDLHRKVGQSLSPPQRLLKNMKFEGIEIALEGICLSGMKITAENRCAGEGKGRKK